MELIYFFYFDFFAFFAFNFTLKPMNILIFLIILAVLVLVHELGHFIVAKKSGIRVDEFGIGFPPRIFGKKFGETVYSINSVPFGGFVKIFGENAESLENPENGIKEDASRSLVHKSKLTQVGVLGAGVTFNVVFAWIIISLGLVFGLPSALEDANQANISNIRVVVSGVSPGSPAELSGIKPGDFLVSLKSEGVSLTENLNPENITNFIRLSEGDVLVSYERGGKILETNITPSENIIAGRKVIGIGMDSVGILKLPFLRAFYEGIFKTASLLKSVTIGIFTFFHNVILGQANFSEVAGPVGMVALVGDARSLGFAYLIFFTALLSLNLAVINLLPFPALDGGRIFLILIEVIKGSPLKPKIVQTVNTVGFALLILLMLVITYKDIVKLFV